MYILFWNRWQVTEVWYEDANYFSFILFEVLEASARVHCVASYFQKANDQVKLVFVWFGLLILKKEKAEKQHDSKACFILHMIHHFRDMKGKLAYLQQRRYSSGIRKSFSIIRRNKFITSCARLWSSGALMKINKFVRIVYIYLKLPKRRHYVEVTALRSLAAFFFFLCSKSVWS